MRPILLSILCLMFAAPVGAAPSGTFRHAHNVGFGAHSSLDPASKGRVLQIIEKIQSRLVRPGRGGKPAPDLATSWTPNADGTVWTFQIRDGVRFHDGRELTLHRDHGGILDDQTGSRWGLDGVAIDGPLEGARLASPPSRSAFWFAYIGAFPDARLYVLGP